jgi:hypothetical protein
VSAIYRERIRRLSQPKIEARQRRQRAIQAVRAANRMTKAVAAMTRRDGADEPQAPPAAFSEILNSFRAEYDGLTGPEQLQFEAVVKNYVAGRVSVGEWIRFSRSVRATYKARLPSEPAPGARIVKDRWVSPPQGW